MKKTTWCREKRGWKVKSSKKAIGAFVRQDSWGFFRQFCRSFLIFCLKACKKLRTIKKNDTFCACAVVITLETQKGKKKDPQTCQIDVCNTLE